MTTIFIAVVDDRHIDPSPYPFTTDTAAIEFARQWAHDHCGAGGEVAEEHVDGYLYFAVYSSEGDGVGVQPRVMDAGEQDPNIKWKL